jgi:hypothetical protein
VVNFWDDQKAAGNWYAANLTHRKKGAEWDTWIVYPPGRSFDDTSVVWGRPILTSREKLRSELEKSLQSSERSHVGK